MHRHLRSGHSVSVGYEFPENKIGEVKIAFAFKSPKDFFSKKQAHTIIKKAFAEGDFITVQQNNDKHIIDIVVDAFNEHGVKLMPPSWKKYYPDGVMLRKQVDLVPVSLSTKAVSEMLGITVE